MSGMFHCKININKLSFSSIEQIFYILHAKPFNVKDLLEAIIQCNDQLDIDPTVKDLNTKNVISQGLFQS